MNIKCKLYIKKYMQDSSLIFKQNKHNKLYIRTKITQN